LKFIFLDLQFPEILADILADLADIFADLADILAEFADTLSGFADPLANFARRGGGVAVFQSH
jgi:hypothetical protein